MLYGRPGNNPDRMYNNKRIEELTQQNIMTANLKMADVIEQLKSTYEEGKGIITIEDMINTKSEDLIRYSSEKNLTPEEIVLLNEFRNAYNQISTRNRLLMNNEKMQKNIVMLSKLFVDRLSYLIRLKKDKFGTVWELPLQFIIYLCKPQNEQLRKLFMPQTEDELPRIKTINNLITDDFTPAKKKLPLSMKPNRNSSTHLERVYAYKLALMQTDDSQTKPLRRGFFNKAVKPRGDPSGNQKQGTFAYEEMDDQSFDFLGADNNPKSKSTGAGVNEKRKEQAKQKMDLKIQLKPRLKVILKKFVRVNIMQMDYPDLYNRRYSFELEGIEDRQTMHNTRINIFDESRRNFSFHEEQAKRLQLKMKKLNKLDFKTFPAQNESDLDFERQNREYWEKGTKKQSDVAKATKPEFANGSTHNTNIAMAVLEANPNVIFKNTVFCSIAPGSPRQPYMAFLLDYKLYLYEPGMNKKAVLCYDIVVRDYEKVMNSKPTASYVIFKNGVQKDLNLALDDSGGKLFLEIEYITAYAASVTSYDLMDDLKNMQEKTSRFYCDLTLDGYQNIRKTDATDFGHSKKVVFVKVLQTEIELCMNLSLRSLKGHLTMREVSIINVPLSSRALDYLFSVATQRGHVFSIIRLEYNGLFNEGFAPLCRYLKFVPLISLDLLSMSGNRIGDLGVEEILGTVWERLETEIHRYVALEQLPIRDLRFSNCGATDSCVQIIDIYQRAVEKIKLSSPDKDKGPKSKYSTKLDLSRNLIGDSGFLDIIGMLRYTSCLHYLNLDENYEITEGGLVKFFGCLDYVSALECLSMRELYITSEVVIYMMRFFYRNPFLHKIVLSWSKEVLREFMNIQRYRLYKYFLISPDSNNTYGNVTYFKFRAEEEERSRFKKMEEAQSATLRRRLQSMSQAVPSGFNPSK